MRAYVITSGLVFGLVVVAHIARVLVEGIQVAGSLPFALGTILALGLCAWAIHVLRRAR